jgi:hypothetical protein
MENAPFILKFETAKIATAPQEKLQKANEVSGGLIPVAIQSEMR